MTTPLPKGRIVWQDESKYQLGTSVERWDINHQTLRGSITKLKLHDPALRQWLRHEATSIAHAIWFTVETLAAQPPVTDPKGITTQTGIAYYYMSGAQLLPTDKTGRYKLAIRISHTLTNNVSVVTIEVEE